MARHRAVIIGAGRIGAGYKWNDSSYTHAGSYAALSDRVELIGFVEPDQERAEAAAIKWHVPALKHLSAFQDFDIVSVCTQPVHQAGVLAQLAGVKGVWCEKPWVSPNVHFEVPVQVNYLRRADEIHRGLVGFPHRKLVVYGKDDETTRCHFRDLSRWWNVPLDYRPFNGPCAYALDHDFFDNGGINPGECMKGMLENLLDAVDGKAELWSPPYVE